MRSNASVALAARDQEVFEQAVTRGSELLKHGKIDDAQGAFLAALAIDRDSARVLALLGLTYFRGNNFAQARPIYEDLVERSPTDASHRLNLGLVYLKLGDSDHAIHSLEASRALDPSQGRAISYLGLAYARAGRYAEAYRSFLIAGQHDLASEIEINLTDAERDGIQSQLRPAPGRTPTPGAPAVARTSTPGASPRTAASPDGDAVRSTPGAPAVSRTSTPPPPPAARTRTSDPTPNPFPARTPTPTGTGIPLRMPRNTPPPMAAVQDPDDLVEIKTIAPRTISGEIASLAKQVASSAPSGVVTLSHDPNARMTDSMQFVLPERLGDPGVPVPAIPQPLDGQTMVSLAVKMAAPSTAGAGGVRTTSGGFAPLPLSQLATEQLVRPNEGTHPFELTDSGSLVIRVTERVMTRLDDVHVTGGDLAFEPALRRSRGHQSDVKFDYGGSALYSVTGHGYLIAVPNKRAYTAVELDDDIFYLREDLVFAFESTLRWESGNVPGLRGRLPVVQFRGDGAVALRSEKPLVRIKLPASGVVFVAATRMAGWIGRVIPRAVVPPSGGPMGEMCIECTGEGVVLVDPVGDPTGLAPEVVVAPAPPPAPTVDEPSQVEHALSDELAFDDLGESRDEI